jgi:hypothetical protein
MVDVVAGFGWESPLDISDFVIAEARELELSSKYVCFIFRG